MRFKELIDVFLKDGLVKQMEFGMCKDVCCCYCTFVTWKCSLYTINIFLIQSIETDSSQLFYLLLFSVFLIV